ncbi:MAG: L,D-transpeptidase [Anaerolineae bacterium]|nr:L,D-transpeptidase [Anaerolineae bacterium]
MSKMLFKVFTVLLLTLVVGAGFSLSMAQPGQAALVFNPAVCAGSATLPELTPDCLAMMEAFPRPVVAPIAEDKFTLSNYSFWRVGPDPVTQYDAPGGNVIGEIPAGFNFVNAVDLSVDGWLQIEGGQWIQQSAATYREPSYFNGVKLLNGLDHPFAFVLDLSRIYVSSTPGGAASQDTGRFLERYELINIFDVAEDSEGWRWYMIGPNQWVKQTFVGKIHKTERPEGVSGRWVAVDLYEQTLIAYEDDTPVFATLVATGIPPNDTNEMVFTVW